ncbi:MAG: hypothetical protein HUU48_07385 [Flavobacteriales bacterium]|nr:hypothetical protein [Flavobacteriales bacterium]
MRKKKIDPIVKLASEIQKIQKQAKALGIFINDRELIECQNCGLLEDVQSNGKLITYFKENHIQDIGLRFLKKNKTFFNALIVKAI